MGFLQTRWFVLPNAQTLEFVAASENNRCAGRGRTRVHCTIFNSLPHTGSRISDLFDDALESLAGDSKMLRSVFNFSLVFHENLAAVGRR
jgi:hypothetical protein